MNTLYSLAQQQLSKQDHYDFGLRALVTVLKYAGRKKRARPDMPDEEVRCWIAHPSQSSPSLSLCFCLCLCISLSLSLSLSQVLLLAMKDMNVAKLTAVDLPLFNGITSDLFPGVDMPQLDYGVVRGKIVLERTLSLSPPPHVYSNSCCLPWSGGSTCSFTVGFPPQWSYMCMCVCVSLYSFLKSRQTRLHVHLHNVL